MRVKCLFAQLVKGRDRSVCHCVARLAACGQSVIVGEMEEDLRHLPPLQVHLRSATVEEEPPTPTVLNRGRRTSQVTRRGNGADSKRDRVRPLSPTGGPGTAPDEAVAAEERFKVISMFSGCGGMDLGFRGGFEFLGHTYERLPFEIVWANDLNSAACRTYAMNLDHRILHGNVWEHLDTMPANADVIVGGFPCQDISVNGKGAGIAGARSGLYRAMVKAVANVRPRLFVAENVKGLLMRHNQEALRTVITDFSALGYRVSHYLTLAADYGVPQTRERVFIVGTRDRELEFALPSAERSDASWITAQEAIGDLVHLPEDRDFSHFWSKAKRSPEQGNRCIVANRPGYTIRAECHGNIQWHYELPRRISMREAARFQSFPDEFRFSGGIREQERQIGNAVPPVLAWHIARAVAVALGAKLESHQAPRFLPTQGALF